MHIRCLLSAGDKVVYHTGAPKYAIRYHISLRMYLLLWNHLLFHLYDQDHVLIENMHFHLEGFTISPSDILLAIFSMTSWLTLSNLFAISLNFWVSESKNPPVVDALTC